MNDLAAFGAGETVFAAGVPILQIVRGPPHQMQDRELLPPFFDANISPRVYARFAFVVLLRIARFT